MSPEEIQAALHRQRRRDAASMEDGGWCAPSDFIYPPEMEMLEPITLPPLSVKRGGFKWPWFQVETLILPVRKRWYSRTRWELHVRFHEAERHMHHYMEFDRRDLAETA